MNEGLIPRRYAKALYKYAIDKGVDKKMYELEGNLVKSFITEPGLQDAMSNPFVSEADKRRLLTTSAGATDADSVFADFLKLLTENNRLDYARDIAVSYREIYRQANGIHRVTVTSAQPMGANEEERLKGLIQQHLPAGSSIEYTSETDPNLIGGFRVEIDNERLDASIANELKQMGRKLIIN